LWYLVVIVP